MAAISILSYPPELRNRIYHDIFSQDTVVNRRSPHNARKTCSESKLALQNTEETFSVSGPLASGLLQTCRQVRSEALGICFSAGTLVLDMNGASAIRFLQTVPSTVRNSLRRLVVRTRSQTLRDGFVGESKDSLQASSRPDTNCFMVGRYVKRDMPRLEAFTLWPSSFEETDWYYPAKDLAALLTSASTTTVKLCYSTRMPDCKLEDGIPAKFQRVREEVERRRRQALTLRVDVERTTTATGTETTGDDKEDVDAGSSPSKAGVVTSFTLERIRN